MEVGFVFGFVALFAANRIAASVREKAKLVRSTYPVEND